MLRVEQTPGERAGFSPLLEPLLLPAELEEEVADDNVANDVYLWDRVSDTMTLVSHAVGSASTAADGASGLAFSLSADGRFVTLESEATNLVSPQSDVNAAADVFVWDRASNNALLLSGIQGSTQATGDGASSAWAMDARGGWITLETSATNLVASGADANGTWDVVRVVNPLAPFFSDGFESSDASAWSSSAP